MPGCPGVEYSAARPSTYGTLPLGGTVLSARWGGVPWHRSCDSRDTVLKVYSNVHVRNRPRTPTVVRSVQKGLPAHTCTHAHGRRLKHVSTANRRGGAFLGALSTPRCAGHSQPCLRHRCRLLWRPSAGGALNWIGDRQCLTVCPLSKTTGFESLAQRPCQLVIKAFLV